MGIEGRQLFWRRSMKKFDAEIRELEVCEWATWHPGYLNRYIVALLEYRGVPYESLEALQARYLSKLSECLTDRTVAQQLLRSIGGWKGDETETEGASAADDDAHSPLRAVVGMLKHRVPMEEPFLRSILQSVCASLKRGIVEKARTLVEQAATLMGIMDEDGRAARLARHTVSLLSPTFLPSYLPTFLPSYLPTFLPHPLACWRLVTCRRARVW